MPDFTPGPSLPGRLGRGRSGNSGSTLRTGGDPERQGLALGVRSEAERAHAAASGADWWAVEPPVGRVASGLPGRVDRLRGLGNAIVPQVAEQLFRWIDQSERSLPCPQ